MDWAISSLARCRAFRTPVETPASLGLFATQSFQISQPLRILNELKRNFLERLRQPVTAELVGLIAPLTMPLNFVSEGGLTDCAHNMVVGNSEIPGLY